MLNLVLEAITPYELWPAILLKFHLIGCSSLIFLSVINRESIRPKFLSSKIYIDDLTAYFAGLNFYL